MGRFGLGRWVDSALGRFGRSLYIYKALKAIFCIRKAIMSDCMNTGLYMTLYNHCVKPILLYGSEVWSIDFLINKSGVTQMENRYDLFIPEKTQLRFFKNVKGVHKYSVNDAVRAEFGVLPLVIFGLQASTNFWVHLLNLQEDSLAYQSYKDSMNFPKGFAQKFKIFLHNIGFSHLWNNQNTFSKKRLLHAVVNKLKESISISGQVKFMMIVKISLMEIS